MRARLLLVLTACLFAFPAIVPAQEADDREPAKVRKITFPEAGLEKSVPMDLSAGPPVIEVKAGKETLRMVVGSDIPFTFLSHEKAEALGLETVRAHGASWAFLNLEIGGTFFENEPCVIDDVKSRLGEAADGIFGHPTLREGAVEFDYPAKRFRLFKGNVSRPDALATLPLDLRERVLEVAGIPLHSGRPVVPAVIDERVTVPFTLATYQTGAPFMPESLWREKLPEVLETRDSNNTAEMKSFSLGGFIGQGFRMGVTDGAEDTGTLPCTLLENHGIVLILDYPGRKLFLETPGLPLINNNAGYTMEKRQAKWEITVVIPNLPAAKAGLKTGDVLLELQGRDCADMNLAQMMQYCDTLDLTGGLVFLCRRSGEAEPVKVILSREAVVGPPPGPLEAGSLRRITVPERAEGATLPAEVGIDLFFVKVKINGMEFLMLLDTGAEISMLSTETAVAAGIKSNGTLKSYSSAGFRGTTERGLAERIELADILIENEPVAIVTSLPEFPLKYGGILGLGTLRDCVFRMDYEGKTLTLWNRKSRPAPAGEELLLPLKIQENPFYPAVVSDNPVKLRPAKCLVEAAIDGKVMDWMVDTGMTDEVKLEEDLVKREFPELLETAGEKRFAGRDLTGAMVNYEITLPAFIFAGQTVSGLQATVSRRAEGEGHAPLLGGRILGRFVLTFDIEAKTLHVLPQKELKGLTEGSSVGITFDFRDGKFYVGSVVSGGGADLAGLREGDRLLAFDGEAVSLEYFQTRGKEVSKRPPGYALKVQYQRGEAEPVTVTVITQKK